MTTAAWASWRRETTPGHWMRAHLCATCGHVAFSRGAPWHPISRVLSRGSAACAHRFHTRCSQAVEKSQVSVIMEVCDERWT